ncbi:MAG: restriction endonuclease [Gammaproteobacteria bacterium]|nr:restriction endonuclease [Gammaproteobacteria bacterium]
MARRQASSLEELLDGLSRQPWWVSVAVAAVVFVALRWVVPYYFNANGSESIASGVIGTLARMARTFAPLAIVFLLPAVVSAIRQWKVRKRFDSYGGGRPNAIHLLDWRQFESLIGEYYRRQGFKVRTNAADGPDGGVDLRLRNDQGLYLVQCKHWRDRKVPVQVVRELYGVMAAEGAYGGAVVTSGLFSADASDFADGKPIDLVDGPNLDAIIAEAQRAGGADDAHDAFNEFRQQHQNKERRGENGAGPAAGAMTHQVALKVLGLGADPTRN